MTGFETIAAQLPELISKMTVVGFAVGAFVTLLTSALCAAVHAFKKMVDGRG